MENFLLEMVSFVVAQRRDMKEKFFITNLMAQFGKYVSLNQLVIKLS